MAETLRIVLLRGPGGDFSLLHQAALRAGHRTVGLICAGSRRRGAEPEEWERKAVAQAAASAPDGLPVTTIANTSELLAALSRQPFDLVVATGFPWRVPVGEIRSSALGVVNLHPSLLPRHRGPFPVHWAIREGDREIGWTAHWMDEDFDTGAILAQAAMPMPQDLESSAFWTAFDPLGGAVLEAALRGIALGELDGVAQDSSAATYAGPFDADFYRIHWDRPAAVVHNQVRTFRFGLPYRAGPLARLGGAPVTVLDTSLVPVPGAVQVQCADGPLWVTDFAAE